MRKLIPARYLELFETREFLILSLIIFLFQVSTSFILLGLIVSVFLKTGSNFGVSGVVLSFSIPGFLLMAFAGLAADIIDRKKIIVFTIFFEAFLVLAIIRVIDLVFLSILFSFLYFATNAFFLPAASAASGQIVKKSQLLVANSVFIFTLAGGQILGFVVAAIVHFFLGNVWTLVICEVITVAAVWLSTFLPKLPPRKTEGHSAFSAIFNIWKVFMYISGKRIIWFYFVMFASAQGLIAFGVTLAPGFFDEVIGLPIDRSPIFVLPMILVGVGLGAIYVQNPKIRESFFVSLGLGLIGIVSLLFGLILKFLPISGRFLLLPTGVFLTSLGFGVIAIMIASRAVLQRKVPQNVQGTFFGAVVVLAAFFAGIMSPLGAGLEALMGYINLLILAGFMFTMASLALARVGNKWKF